jgi:hypothetical protein
LVQILNRKVLSIKHRFLFVGIIVAIIAFTGGFYTYAALVKQLELLIPIAIIFAALTWLGSGADFTASYSWRKAT